MPICGFNQKMLEGLTMFGEGLVEHGLIERARIKGCSVQAIHEREISDMDRFLRETHGIVDPQIREVTEALTRYSRGVYVVVHRNGIPNYQRTVMNLRDFYVEMDRKFYAELEGKPDAMKQLVESLNRVKI